MILQFCTSFSHDANDAFNTSVSFLFVPGVSGGICVGISKKIDIIQFKTLNKIVFFPLKFNVNRKLKSIFCFQSSWKKVF